MGVAFAVDGVTNAYTKPFLLDLDVNQIHRIELQTLPSTLVRGHAHQTMSQSLPQPPTDRPAIRSATVRLRHLSPLRTFRGRRELQRGPQSIKSARARRVILPPV